MRHRRRGRKLGRNPAHQRALLRNLASALFLTERDDDYYDAMANLPQAPKPPKEKGRIVTTLHKAKEVRPLVEKCITIARRTLNDQRKAIEFASGAERNTEEWRAWRKSKQWHQWSEANAPVLTARRRVIKLLGDKEATQILFDEIALRFEDRPGGYTRIVRLAKPRLGDGGQRALLEFVGKNDRVAKKPEEPSFDSGGPTTDTDEVAEDQTSDQEPDTEDAGSEEAAADELGEESAEDTGGEAAKKDA